jgi:adenylyltransferase/sulfurtransferase
MPDVGENKAARAVEILQERYPHQHFMHTPEQLTATNAIQLLKGATIVIDCTDNFQARYLINDACVQLKLPFVYGALHKFEGQVCVFNVEDGPTYRCIFPEVPKAGNQPNCSDVGVLGVLPGIIGTMQALEAIKYIVGMTGLLSQTLLTYNALNTKIQHIRLPKRNLVICNRIASTPLQQVATPKCETVLEMSWEALEQNSAFQQIVDLRDSHELPESPKCTTHRISARNLSSELHRLDPSLPVALFCQSGQRSRECAQKLTTEHQFTHVVSISGGMNEHLNLTGHEELL